MLNRRGGPCAWQRWSRKSRFSPCGFKSEARLSVRRTYMRSCIFYHYAVVSWRWPCLVVGRQSGTKYIVQGCPTYEVVPMDGYRNVTANGLFSGYTLQPRWGRNWSTCHLSPMENLWVLTERAHPRLSSFGKEECLCDRVDAECSPSIQALANTVFSQYLWDPLPTWFLSLHTLTLSVNLKDEVATHAASDVIHRTIISFPDSSVCVQSWCFTSVHVLFPMTPRWLGIFCLGLYEYLAVNLGSASPWILFKFKRDVKSLPLTLPVTRDDLFFWGILIRLCHRMSIQNGCFPSPSFLSSCGYRQKVLWELTTTDL